MDRNLTLETVRLTEAAALYAGRYMGKGDENIVNNAASEAIVSVFSTMNINGNITVGTNDHESLKDGIQVGAGGSIDVDIAVKPLDGKITCARGGHNALSIVAIGSHGAFLKVPNLYMKKIAVGKEAARVVDINQPIDINIKRVARAKNKYIEDITVCVLDREMNREIVKEVRETGARIKYITDGDISGAIATALDDNPLDILIGYGGAKEGVLAAAALKCLGGNLQAKFVYKDSYEKKNAAILGAGDPDKIFEIDDLILADDVMVSATGITDGVLLQGVRFFSGGGKTSSLVLRKKTQTLRLINSTHYFDSKPLF